VEEGIPLQEDHSGKNFSATIEEDPDIDYFAANDFVTATMEEDPGTNWYECWKEDNAEGNAHLTPISCRLKEYHLGLIFKMCKDMTE